MTPKSRRTTVPITAESTTHTVWLNPTDTPVPLIAGLPLPDAVGVILTSAAITAPSTTMADARVTPAAQVPCSTAIPKTATCLAKPTVLAYQMTYGGRKGPISFAGQAIGPEDRPAKCQLSYPRFIQLSIS